MTPSSQQVTQWLVAWSNGDSAALDQLIPLVHEELRRLARRHMGQERLRDWRFAKSWLLHELDGRTGYDA